MGDHDSYSDTYILHEAKPYECLETRISFESGTLNFELLRSS